jgi:uncharacterized membrane protein
MELKSMLIYIWHLLITMGESKEGRKTSKTEKAREKNRKRLLSNRQIWLFLMLTTRDGGRGGLVVARAPLK